MEIRRLRTDDLPQLNRMHVVVFNMRKDFSGEATEKADPLMHPAEWSWGVFDDKGRLISGIVEPEFLMTFDGKKAKMSGIGGVGTLPESRKGGHVRHIFEKLLPEAYEKGVVFSNLTPFSHDFYRMFGYEICCARNNLTIASRHFLKHKLQGEFTQIFPGDDTSALQAVHAAYISTLNHGIARDYWPDNRSWKIFTQSEPYSTGIFLYLWKDENGVPRSYIKYQDVEEGGEHTMSVIELAFIDTKGLYGALSIVGGLSSQYAQFRWPTMPTFIDPTDFIGDAWAVEQRITARDMTRVVNVKTALEMMRRPALAGTPAGEGSYCIEVEDANITANSGTYLVEFGSQGTLVSSVKREPDLRCDIRVLSQLVTGYRTLDNLLVSRQTGVELCGNRDTLSSVFTLRPQHVTEFF
ncbi:MAG: GNAT family N-acetyltransferase [Spirochaetaceae bacterium]|jgi:predicted acetyltransferase|nr:GNAT family N-acetyltransferase [Spirochaetaceae bacterium]